ncbi:unnamed protein product [Phytophthora fragariaefolia]|uniref:Unnamed protein product n=1 Tax=Phytophthora fragariaefolia TaxID=1490495 RepID=A0A9W6WR32_9STRA|nr:unnamed protein product [Phytophthora fragariaefolia]
MASPLKLGFGRQSDALAWRREVNRPHEIALKMVKEYQVVEKREERVNPLSRQAYSSLPRPRVNENSEDSPADAEDTGAPVDESPRSLFVSGDRVLLYME